MPVDVLVPPLGTTVDTMTLLSWYKQEGEPVLKDEPLFVVETDKATLDVEAPASGILCQVCAEPGSEVTALSRIATIRVMGESEGVESREPRVESPGQVDSAEPVSCPVPAEVRSLPTGASSRSDTRTFVSPRAKRLAEANGIDWRVLAGTGPEGAIVERDIRAHEFRGLPKTASPVILNAHADATPLVEFRDQLAKARISVSYNALLMKLLGIVLMEHPRMNATLEGDTVKLWSDVNVGLAIEAEGGLRTPTVRNVNSKGICELTAEIEALSHAARAGNALLGSTGSGTFTLTNLGMYGIASFTPIIDDPRCAVLGVGKIGTESDIASDSESLRHMVWLSLAFDRRLFEVGLAARFLQQLVELIQRPYRMLI